MDLSLIRRVAIAGQSTWWINAVLDHRVAPDVAVDHLSGAVSFTPDPPAPWLFALGRLRSLRISTLHLRVVTAGDPAGLPGPAAVTRAAVAAGVAMVAGDGTLTLIPVADTGRWHAVASSGQPPGASPLGTVAESRTLMRTAMAELTASFTSLEPDDEALAELTALRALPGPEPPPGTDSQAAQLSGDALRVWWLTDIADRLCARQGRVTPAPVRSLEPLARRAISNAFSV